MSNADRTSFERRLSRLDQIHAAGGAFEARGALGRSFFDARRQKEGRPLPLRAVAMVLAGALLFKGALLAQIGPETYDQRVSLLAQGNGLERVGAWVMRADAPTQWIAAQLGSLLGITA